MKKVNWEDVAKAGKMMDDAKIPSKVKSAIDFGGEKFDYSGPFTIDGKEYKHGDIINLEGSKDVLA